jgi:hypothetical protein
VTKALFGDSGGRRQEGGEHNNQPKEGRAAKMPAIEAMQQATTSRHNKRTSRQCNNYDAVERNIICAARWSNKEPSKLKDMLKILYLSRNMALLGGAQVPLEKGSRIFQFPKNGIYCTDLHHMHHLSSLWNNFTACDVLSAAAGEKT